MLIKNYFIVVPRQLWNVNFRKMFYYSHSTTLIIAAFRLLSNVHLVEKFYRKSLLLPYHDVVT